MIVAEPVLRGGSSERHPRVDLLPALDRAMKEENAPVRSAGPGLGALSLLAVQQVIRILRAVGRRDRPKTGRFS